MRQLAIVIALIFYFTSIIAQNFAGWSEHLPYRKAKQIVASSQHVYCLTESGLFSYSLLDNEILPYSKTNILSDSEVSAIGWSDEFELLVVGYANGNIDLLSNDGVVNIPDIKRFSGFADKSIRVIHVNDDTAYLGTKFGIVAVNIEKQEVSDTYLIGNNGAELQINDIQTSNELIWAASENGIYQADLNSSNLSDFNNWNQLTELPNSTLACHDLEYQNNQLFVLRKPSSVLNEIYQLNGGVWSEFHTESEEIFSIRTFDNILYVIVKESVKEFELTGVENSQIIGSNTANLRDMFLSDGRTFIADYERSLLEYTGNNFNKIKPDGPLRSDISTIYSVEKQTWTSAGVSNGNVPAELFVFTDAEWNNLTNENISELADKNDITTITANKRDENKLYAGSWGDGIFEFENQELSNYYHSGNSPLSGTGVSAMASDLDGLLWILDANSTNAIKVLSNEGEWITLSYNSLNNREDARKLIALSNGDKWVLRGLSTSLFAFNENGTLSNNDDDVMSTFTVRDENNSSISSQIYDITEDQDGSVWVGTSSGVAIYGDPGTIFRDGDFFAYRPIITIDGSTQFLLSTERVQAIEVNGANQKWLGTQSSGAFLVSDNGDKQLEHFTTLNSPLPSNNIQKISVNPGTGEVFFITDKGMVSYKGKVTEGTENYNELYVYPNPVRETYHGDITVSGLMSNSTVKITNVSGNLVWEGRSEGGQFIWDGRNFNGSRVHTGIYLIFCSNSDGSKSKVIKLLFIN